MIKYRLTLDDGSQHFVAARSFSEAIAMLNSKVPCVELQRPKTSDLPEVVIVELWDTDVCSRFELPMYLKECI